jgi:hypothetical protein
MKFRRRTVLFSAPLLLAGGVLSLPAVHWRLIGWWQGEAFYQDRPSSWWAREIQQSYSWSPQVGPSVADVSGPRFPIAWHRRRTFSPGESIRRQFTGPPTLNSLIDALMAAPPLADGDEAALPVLLELLRQEDPKVRLLAACGLAALGRRATPAVWNILCTPALSYNRRRGFSFSSPPAPATETYSSDTLSTSGQHSPTWLSAPAVAPRPASRLGHLSCARGR